jgi:NitT/TauT family transport system substrate-binding protein
MMFYPSDKKRHSILRIAFALVSISGLLAGSISCQKQEKQTGPKGKITIGTSPIVMSMPVVIAQQKGFISDAGLDATIRYYPTGKKALEGMFAGEVDIASVTDTPIVLNSFIRDDFSVFASTAYSHNDIKAVGRKDRGVNKPADLKGKKIGIVSRTASHYFTHIYLTEHGIDPSAVKLVDFLSADLPGALKDGKVDAIVITEPYAHQAMKALPDMAVRLPKSNLYKVTFHLAAMRSYAKRSPETLRKVLIAVDRTITFMKQNKTESIAVITKNLKMEEDFLVSTWDDFVFRLSLDQSLLTILEDQARWAMQNRVTDKTEIPNYLGYIYLDALKGVKPGAVTIIQQAVTE